MAVFDLNTLFCVVDGIYSKKDKDSFVVLTNDRKSIFELEGVAFDTWNHLQNPISFRDLLEKIGKIYSVKQNTLEEDLKNWIEEALEEKLIKIC